MNDDPIVASVRGVRAELAAKFNYDVHAIFSDMRARESEFGDRLVRQSKSRDERIQSPGSVGRVENGESSVAAG